MCHKCFHIFNGLNLQKIKNVKQFLMLFIETVNESHRKPINLWVDQGREFNNKFMQEWLYSKIF